MDHLLALGGLVGAAAITPGPNNLIVLRAAAHAGMRDALPAIAGIVFGGLLLLGTLGLGVDTALATHPALRQWIAVIGAMYLVWRGTALLVVGLTPGDPGRLAKRALPAGGPGLIGFQFLNPKAWVLVLTALAASPADGVRGYLSLAGLFVLIPTLCLLLWAALGARLAHRLAQPRVRRGVDLALGSLLIICSFPLLLGS